jgi:DNA-binding NtrC family response regulator
MLIGRPVRIGDLTMLDDVNVMVVEDEALIALDLSLCLEDAGAAVMGPFAEVRTARMAMEREAVDAAILDVDVADGTVIPLADMLWRSRIPFVFHTGTPDLDALRSRYDGVPILPKSQLGDHVVHQLGSLVAVRP